MFRYAIGALILAAMMPEYSYAGGKSSFGISIGISGGGCFGGGYSGVAYYNSGYCAPAPRVYCAPRRAYCPPRVVYRPVYVAPAPVYCAPAPVYCAPAPVVCYPSSGYYATNYGCWR